MTKTVDGVCVECWGGKGGEPMLLRRGTTEKLDLFRFDLDFDVDVRLALLVVFVIVGVLIKLLA